MKISKTVIFGIAVLLLSIFQTIQSSPILAHYQGPIDSFIAIAIIVLRAITTSPLFTDKDDTK